jgi:hypothetical protein
VISSVAVVAPAKLCGRASCADADIALKTATEAPNAAANRLVRTNRCMFEILTLVDARLMPQESNVVSAASFLIPYQGV